MSICPLAIQTNCGQNAALQPDQIGDIPVPAAS